MSSISSNENTNLYLRRRGDKLIILLLLTWLLFFNHPFNSAGIREPGEQPGQHPGTVREGAGAGVREAAAAQAGKAGQRAKAA